MHVEDQMGRKLHLKKTPQRIVSLVPSITEFLVDLGVSVVGRTKFCIHPSDQVVEITKVGGTKKFRFDVIDSLTPDLIVGNKEENYQEGILHLEKKYPVWMSDISDIDTSFEMMRLLGIVLDKEIKAEELILQIKKNIESFNSSKRGKVIYLIWSQPWMAVGKGTFVDSMLSFLGYDNVIERSRYPILSAEDFVKLAPEKILLSSEPFPFKSKHEAELKTLLPNTEIIHVDGEAYSWYGSRLGKVVY